MSPTAKPWDNRSRTSRSRGERSASPRPQDVVLGEPAEPLTHQPGAPDLGEGRAALAHQRERGLHLDEGRLGRHHRGRATGEHRTPGRSLRAVGQHEELGRRLGDQGLRGQHGVAILEVVEQQHHVGLGEVVGGAMHPRGPGRGFGIEAPIAQGSTDCL